MTDELDRFATAARRTVESGYYARIPPGAPGRAGPSLKASLLAPGRLPVIAEIKPKSPTAGALRADADAGDLARAFLEAGARGVSVLAEPHRFGGSLENVVEAARASPAGSPVLFKDFVVADSQLDAAAACGASAVLLILAILDRGQADWPAADAVRAAHTRGLEVLMEVYTREEYARASRLRVDLVGVNNRDLRDLTMDTGRTARILADGGKLAPTLSLSGIESRHDLLQQLRAGAAGALVGSALMRASDPAKTLEEWIA